MAQWWGLYRDLYIRQKTEEDWIRVWSSDGSSRSFQFYTELKSGEPYNVETPFIGYNFTCEITNGQGTVTDHDITDILIECTEPENPEPAEPVVVSTLELEGVRYLYGIDYAPNGYLYLTHNAESIIKVHPDTGRVWTVVREGEHLDEFDTHSGISVGPDGYIYVNDTEGFTSYRISPRYDVSVWLPYGTAFTAFDLDVGPDGYIYVADYGNERILKVSPEGEYTVLVELGEWNPMGLAVGEDGTVYFTISQLENLYRWKDGQVTVVAGGDVCGFKDGSGRNALFCALDGLAIDRDGNIIVADRFNNAIRRVTPDGLVTTVAGTGVAGEADGSGEEATFDRPRSVTTLPDGRIATNSHYGKVRIITPVGDASTIAQ